MPARRTRSASADEGVGGSRRSGRRGKSNGSSNKNDETNADTSVVEDMSVDESEDEVEEDEEDSDVSDAKPKSKSKASKLRKGTKKGAHEGQQLSLKSFAVKGTKTSKMSSSDVIRKKAASAKRSARRRASNNDAESDTDGDENDQRPRRSSRAGRKAVNLNEKSLANDEDEDDDESEEGHSVDGEVVINANDADYDNLDDRMASENDDEKKDDVVRRKSSRSTKFASSMAEPTPTSGFEMDALPASPSPAKNKKKPTMKKQAAKKEQQVPKSPAIRHTSKRKHKSPVKHDEEEYEGADMSEEEEEGDYSDDGDDESQEEMKIQKIIASRSETHKKWAGICKKLNTSEVDNGSRWFQEPAKHSGKSSDTYEERYLVKWLGLSYLHCSWETKDDLLELIDTAKTHLRNFFAKSHGGYFFSADERGDGDYFDPGYVGIDRVLEVVDGDEDDPEDADHPHTMVFDRDDPDYESGTGRQFLIKWASLPYSDSTYEFERDLIISNVDYEPQVEALEKRILKPTKKDAEQADKAGDGASRKLFMTFGESNKIMKTAKAVENREALASKFQKKLENQKFLNGGQLRDYQAEGVSWLLSNYINNRSCILADEMGLGKTIQTACYVNYVARKLKRRGPFLIVAPLSTIPHWTREFRGWTDLNTVVYYGSQDDRANIRQNEFPFFEDRPEIYNNKSHYLKRCHKKKAKKYEKTWMVEVVITTPETLVLEDYKELCAVDWDILVVDEAHRLKNHESKLAINMTNADFRFNNILLLTGTPIQNNLNELWALLHFADREKFPRLEDFAAEYGEMKSKEKIDQLHQVIRPYILRRLKEDVEKSVPPKEETLIEVELTSTQKQYYRALYEKNVQFLHRNRTKLDMPSVSNLAMQLRKCCNSAFLIKGVEDEIRRKEKQDKSNIAEADLLVKSSGKLVLLDKLLPRLKRDGHKLLIFSQFKIMLDIIEDYLNLREVKHERIDGSITGNKRQNAIDRFQAKDEEGKESPFVMLLTTKAGGVGINLTAADTVIIFDSDWNPQNDLQAQARCHRIGQTKSVKIYRLLSRKTYEMQMFHMSSLKMGLDQAVLQGVENKGGGSKGKAGLSKEEIEKLLRHGAYDIFNEEKAGKGDTESDAFISADIDSILSRAKTVVHDNTGSKSGVAGGTFSKASFKVPGSSSKTSGADDTAEEDVDIDDPEFWTKMVGEAKDESQSPLIAQKRRRFNGNYQEAREGDLVAAASDSDASKGSADSSDDDLSEDIDKNMGERQRWGGTRSIDWDRKDVEKVIRTLLQYGYRMDHIAQSLSTSKACKHNSEEIKRMSASVIIVLLKELAAEEAAALLSKNTQDATNADDSKSTITPVVTDPEKGSDADEYKTQEKCFKQLLEQNRDWLLMGPLKDAYGAFHGAPRRSEATKSWIKAKRSGEDEMEAKEPLSPLEVAFNQNLLPALTSRGWKVETVERRNNVKTSLRYTYQDNSYHTVAEVLQNSAAFHPELINVVHSIQSSAPAENLENEARGEDVYKSLSLLLKPELLTLSCVSQLLDSLAPLQLIADRFKSAKLSLQKRILSSCYQMYNANVLLGRAAAGPTEEERLDALASVLKCHRKANIPHPLWTSKHDAMLVRGIYKYGFLVSEIAYDRVKNDPTLHWESGVDIRSFQATPVSKLDEFVVSKTSTAKAAAAFLTEEEDLLEDLQGLNKDFLVQTLCLNKDESSWSVDAAGLERDLRSAKPARPAFVLPLRVELLKRGKNLLSRLPTSAPQGSVQPRAPSLSPIKEGAPHVEEATHVSGFTVIDRKDPKYTLLVELLRWITKVKQAHLRSWPRLLKFANKECDRLVTELDSSAAIKIKQHLQQIKAGFDAKMSFRLLKNVIRVMLGVEPYGNPKNPNEPNFPFGPGDLLVPTVAPVDTKKTRLPRSAFFADAAIDRCLKLTAQAASKTKADDLSKDDDALALTMTEYVLLRAVTSFGLPKWDENSKKNISEGVFSNDGEMDLSWRMLCDALLHFSADWVKGDESAIDAAKANVEKLQMMKALPDAIESATQKLTVFEKKAKEKRNVHRNAIDLSEKPTMMAQKTVMLIEALRRTSGSNDSKYSSTKNPNRWMKHENGIGSRVVDWCRDEIRRWAKAVKVMNKENMLPLCTVAADYMKNSPDLCICMMVDKKSARTIFAQIAQQSRLRSIISSEGEEFDQIVAKGAKMSRKTGDIWPEEPSWWQCKDTDEASVSVDHDVLLLKGIAKHGYFGFDDVLLENDMHREYTPEKTNSILLKSAAQTRIYHLTRELNNIHMMKDKLLFTQNVMRSMPHALADSSTSSQHKQQTLIGSFFNAQKAKSAANMAQATFPVKSNTPSGKSFVMDVTTAHEEEEEARVAVASSGEKRPREEAVQDAVILIDVDEPASTDKKQKVLL